MAEGNTPDESGGADLRATPARPAGTADSAFGPGVVLERRYRLADEVGRGGAGIVFRAQDLVTGHEVAVKVLLPGPGAEPPRVRREVSALRLLRILGVVALLDEGTDPAHPFLVMEFVRGTPFPGTGVARSWEALAPVAERFLEVLARVHAAGVLHRDLKPSNVLVDSGAVPTILDFGLSWGPSLGASVTEPGTVMGTPAYLSPEQLLGRPTDARTDIYAAGVMLYEALTGRIPHEARDIHELIHQRASRLPLSVSRLDPSVPAHVAETIDAMLAIRAADRPGSAGEVLRRLFDRETQRGRLHALPRIGPRAPLEALVAAALEGRSVDVAGARGSGRSRLLADAAAELEGRGRRVVWAVPGSAPFASLRQFAAGLADADLRTVVASVDERLRAAVAAGSSVFADDAARLDPMSAAALSRLPGGVVRVIDTPSAGAIVAPILSEPDLAELFAGPDRVLHLREDAAREMWLRTGGIVSRVAAETAAWVRNGIAYAEGGKFVVRRSALDSIRGSMPLTYAGDTPADGPEPASAAGQDLLASIALAWPDSTAELAAAVRRSPRWTIDAEIAALEADGFLRRLPDARLQPLVVPHALVAWPADRRAAEHAAIAAALPAGSVSRFRHLHAAGAVESAADEAVLVAAALTHRGDTSRAAVVLAQALGAVREARDVVREVRLLVEYGKTSMFNSTLLALDHAIYEAGRMREKPAEVAQLERLLRAAADAARGGGEAALELLDGCGPFSDLDLELWRQTQRHRAARNLPAAREECVVAEIGAWAVARGDSRSLVNYASAKARLLARQRRYDAAAESHLAAARGTDHVAARIGSLLNAADALLESSRLEEASLHAAAAGELAASCRRHANEAHAVWIGRSVAYRGGAATSVDEELLSSASQLGAPGLEAMLCLNEAAVAWRIGQRGRASEIAARATRNWRKSRVRGPALLARTLEIASGADEAPEEWDRLAEEAANCELPGLAVQALGLLAHARPERAASLADAVARRAAELGPESRSRRREVISPEEAVNWTRPPQ